jgi:hypothetical protein
VVLLWITGLVVDFLSNQEQNPAWSAAIVSFHALYQHIMVAYDDRVQPSLQGGMDNIFMRATSVRETSVHM